MSTSKFYRDPAAAPIVTESTREKAIAYITEADSTHSVPISRRFPPLTTTMTEAHRVRSEVDHLLSAARLQWFQGLTKAQEDSVWANNKLQESYFATFKNFFIMERTGYGMFDERHSVELPPVYDQTLFKAMAFITNAPSDIPYSRRYSAAPGEGLMPHEQEAKELLDQARQKWNEGLNWAMEMRYWREPELFQERYLELFESSFVLLRRNDAFYEEIGI